MRMNGSGKVMKNFPSANDVHKMQNDRRETILNNTLEFIRRDLEKASRNSVFVNNIDVTINIEVYPKVREYLIEQGYKVKIINDEGLKRTINISWEKITE